MERRNCNGFVNPTASQSNSSFFQQMENPITISQQTQEDDVQVRLSFSDLGTSDASHEHTPTAATTLDFDFQFYSPHRLPVSSQRDDVFLLFGKTTKPLIDGNKKEDYQILCESYRDDDLMEERLFLLRSRSFKELKSSSATTITKASCVGPRRSPSSRKMWIGIIGIPSRTELSDIKRRQTNINRSTRWLSAKKDGGGDSTAAGRTRWGLARKWKWYRPLHSMGNA